MSTKIYDAYCLKILPFPEFHKWMKQIEELCKKAIAEDLIKNAATIASKIIDQQIIRTTDLKPFTKEYPKWLEHIYRTAKYHPEELLRCWEDNADHKRKLSGKPYNLPVALLVKKFLTNQAKTSTITNSYTPLEIENRLLLYSIDNKTMIIQGFGSQITRILEQLYLSESPEHPLKTAVQLREFHYQDQTDRPDTLSENEWNYRKTIYDQIFKKNPTPKSAGIDIWLTDRYTISFMDDTSKYLKQRDKRIAAAIPDKTYRAEKLARDLLIEQALTASNKQTMPASDILDLTRQYLSVIDNKDTTNPIYQNYLQLRDRLSQLLPDITENTLRTTIAASS